MYRWAGKRIRQVVSRSAADLFSEAPQPLTNTHTFGGDPGLLGPDSVSWKVIGDEAAFIGGIRALLIQTAHPEVLSGFMDHSSFRSDTLGRLARTSSWVVATTFGARPEVDAAVKAVKSAHGRVKGVSQRGKQYKASDPDLAAWVHNALVDSFLVAYRNFGPAELSQDDCDRFILEQKKIGTLLHAEPLPLTAEAVSEWLAKHDAVEASALTREAVEFSAEAITAKKSDAQLPAVVLGGSINAA